MFEMLADVNWLVAVGAAVANMVVGSILYAPGIFGNKWMKLVGLTEKKAKKGAPMAMFLSFLLSVVMAGVLSLILGSGLGLVQGVLDGLVVGGGIALATVVMHQLYEQRDGELIAIAIVHELLAFAVMGGVIGLFA